MGFRSSSSFYSFFVQLVNIKFHTFRFGIVQASSFMTAFNFQQKVKVSSEKVMGKLRASKVIWIIVEVRRHLFTLRITFNCTSCKSKWDKTEHSCFHQSCKEKGENYKETWNVYLLCCWNMASYWDLLFIVVILKAIGLRITFIRIFPFLMFSWKGKQRI